MLRRASLLFVLICALLAPATACAAICEPERFVISAGEAILRAVRSGSASGMANVANRYGDIRSLALFSLGPYRKNLPKGREAEYVSLTRAYIGRFLAQNARRVQAANLTVVACSGSALTPTVTTRLSSGGKAVFRLYKTRKGYLVRDVNISSIWLGAQLRSTFTGVIQRNRGDISALFAYLR